MHGKVHAPPSGSGSPSPRDASLVRASAVRASGVGVSVVLGLATLAVVAPMAAAAPPGRSPPAFVVAVDPGHGGSNLGAAGGTPAVPIFEKQITLELARRLRARLEQHPGLRVVLCRERDVLVPIRARARCVERAHASLFISLHANASPPSVERGSRHGFELYVLSPQEVEDDAIVAGQLADDADAVWAAHEVHASAERAVLAARLIEARLKEALGARASRGIRQTGAALDVLRGKGAPGVLIEVGFIDDADEGGRLASQAGQEAIATALAAAVLDLTRL